MIHTALKLSRSATTVARLGPTCRPSFLSAPPFRLLHDGINGPDVNPLAAHMINHGLSLARLQNSDESYAQGMLILEHCLSILSTQSSEDQLAHNSRGAVFLAMSTLSYERGNFGEAVEKLKIVQDLKQSSLAVRVASMEALVGLGLQLGQDDTSSVLADKCLELLEINKPETGGGGYGVISSRAKAVKGLVELVRGNLESAESFFGGLQDHDGCTGSVALSYGEFLHATQNFSLAKELYQKVAQGVTENKDYSDINALEVCNMASEEVLLAATLALGQLEAHMGNFADAEEILTKALTKTEQQFGDRHPKVGAALTCIALMYGRKAMLEHSSSLIVQEGLYRRALEILKAPPLESEGAKTKADGRDIMALARGGYGESLCLQQNRKSEGERMKRWAEAAWRNHRMSLAEALDFSEPSNKMAVVDARISRVL